MYKTIETHLQDSQAKFQRARKPELVVAIKAGMNKLKIHFDKASKKKILLVATGE